MFSRLSLLIKQRMLVIYRTRLRGWNLHRIHANKYFYMIYVIFISGQSQLKQSREKLSPIKKHYIESYLFIFWGQFVQIPNMNLLRQWPSVWNYNLHPLFDGIYFEYFNFSVSEFSIKDIFNFTAVKILAFIFVCT